MIWLQYFRRTFTSAIYGPSKLKAEQTFGRMPAKLVKACPIYLLRYTAVPRKPSFKSKSCLFVLGIQQDPSTAYLVARLTECLLPEPVATVVRLYANQFHGTPPWDISRKGRFSGQTWVKGSFAKANMTCNAPTEHIPTGLPLLQSRCTHPGDRLLPGVPTA